MNNVEQLQQLLCYIIFAYFLYIFLYFCCNCGKRSIFSLNIKNKIKFTRILLFLLLYYKHFVTTNGCVEFYRYADCLFGRIC